METNELSGAIIAAAIEVYERLGPGLLQSANRVSLVNSQVVVELKAKSEIHPVDKAQTLSHLRLLSLRFGPLINFHEVACRWSASNRERVGRNSPHQSSC